MSDFAGVKIMPDGDSLNVQRVPLRKSFALVHNVGVQGRVLAYFRDEAAAREAMEFLERLTDRLAPKKLPERPRFCSCQPGRVCDCV